MHIKPNMYNTKRRPGLTKFNIAFIPILFVDARHYNEGRHSINEIALENLTKCLLNDIRDIVASIQGKYQKPDRIFRCLRDGTSVRGNFEAQKEIFKNAVDDGQLFPLIEGILRRKSLDVEQALYYYSSNPISDPPGVKEARDRLYDTLEHMKEVEQQFEGVKSIAESQRALQLRKQVLIYPECTVGHYVFGY